MSEATDADLVRRTIRGDRDAFRPLVQRYQERVYLLANSWLRDHSEAQDVTQETFYVAYRKLPDLRDTSKFGPWLFGVARNLCHVAMRRRRLLEDSVPLETVENQLADKTSETMAGHSAMDSREGLLAQLHEGLGNLPDKYQVLLRLKYLSGVSYREIAETMDLPEATIKSRLYEARQMLRERIQEQEAGRAKSRSQR